MRTVSIVHQGWLWPWPQSRAPGWGCSCALGLWAHREQLQREGPWCTSPTSQGLGRSTRGLEAEAPPALDGAGLCKGWTWGKSCCHTALPRAEPGTAISSCVCAWHGFPSSSRGWHRATASSGKCLLLHRLWVHHLRKDKGQQDQMETFLIGVGAYAAGNDWQFYR